MTTASIIDHPLLNILEQKLDKVDFSKDWKRVLKKMPSSFAPIPVDPIAPSYHFTPNEELFEWIDVVESVAKAKERFVMFELGAGYGRWCINAMIALKFLNPIPFHFVAVEAEKSHYNFLEKYFLAHRLKLEEHRLIKAAIDTVEKSTLFHMGEAKHWYGQCIDDTPVENKNWVQTLLEKIEQGFQRKKDQRRKEVVRTITLNSLLEDYPKVDLIDMDIQGKELEVIRDSIKLLNQKTKRLHIGTHSHEIDSELEKLLTLEGWRSLNLLPLFGTSKTPYGTITCNDGVQTWINPRLE